MEGERERVRVLVVDDSAVFRQVAGEVVAATRGFVLVGTEASGDAALAAAAEAAPDMVLLDVNMPGLPGIETARRLAAARPRTVVVLMSADTSGDQLARRLEHAVVAVLDKRTLSPAALADLWRLYAPG